MSATRCKMKLDSVMGGFYNDANGRDGRLIRLLPATSEENANFFAPGFGNAPSGELKVHVTSAALTALGIDESAVGREFYIDITPVQ
jgi:hypothetical protein